MGLLCGSDDQTLWIILQSKSEETSESAEITR